MDLEARFALQFRDVITLPVPETMTKTKKMYPSVIRKEPFLLIQLHDKSMHDLMQMHKVQRSSERKRIEIMLCNLCV